MSAAIVSPYFSLQYTGVLFALRRLGALTCFGAERRAPARFGGGCALIGLKVHSEGLAQLVRSAEDGKSAMRLHLLPYTSRGGISARCLFPLGEGGCARATLQTVRAQETTPKQ